MATADQVRNQRADQERSHVILLKEAEFRPQFLLRDNVRADHPSDVQKRLTRIKLGPLAERSSTMVNVSADEGRHLLKPDLDQGGGAGLPVMARLRHADRF
jgi:hypothetical protein